jgi:hypothetical protein
MRLACEKGCDVTSVSDLLEAAGVDSASLLGVVSAREDLRHAVVGAYRSGIRKMFFEPAWRDVSDPIERIFCLLAGYRRLFVKTQRLSECSIGRPALAISEPDLPVRELLAANFNLWTDAVLECLFEAGYRFPDALDRLSLAEFVLITTEGALMQSSTFRDVDYFDRAVRELRKYVEMLLYGQCGLSAPVRQALAAFVGAEQLRR